MKIEWAVGLHLTDQPTSLTQVPVVRVEALREKLEHWAEYWNGLTNNSAMIDALEHITGEINGLLAGLKEQS